MPLRKAGVIPNYYPDIEDELTAIEETGRPIIEKIRRATSTTQGPVITPDEKHAFVAYVGNLHKRVTNRTRRTKPIWENIVREFAWDSLQKGLAHNGLFAAARKVDEVRATFVQGMPDAVRQPSILIPYDRTAAKLRTMTWRFLIATAPQAFVTSDDPVYLSGASMFLALAGHVALLAQLSGPDDCTVHSTDAAGVEQCNRATIRAADEHVYSAQPNQWVGDTFNE